MRRRAYWLCAAVMLLAAPAVGQAQSAGPTLQYVRSGREMPQGVPAAMFCLSNSTTTALEYHNHPPSNAPDRVVDMVIAGVHTNLFVPDVHGGAQSLTLAPGAALYFFAGAGLGGPFRVGVVYAAAEKTQIVWSAFVPWPPPAPAPVRPVQARYRGLGVQHWVALASPGGAQVRLEDGSVWEISRAYRALTMFWAVSDRVTVAEGPTPGWPYQLSNGTRGGLADARLVSP